MQHLPAKYIISVEFLLVNTTNKKLLQRLFYWGGDYIETHTEEEYKTLRELYKQQANVIQLLMASVARPPNLDNCIYPGVSPPEGEEDSVASKYRERVEIGVDSSGNPIYKWASGSNKGELHKAIAALFGTEVRVEQPVSQGPLWNQYVVNWFETFVKPKLRPKTQITQSTYVSRHLAMMFDGKTVGEITVPDIQNELLKRKDFSKSYVRDLMNLMKRCFASAVEDGIRSDNPMLSTRVYNPSHIPVKKRRALTMAEQKDIIAHIDDLALPGDRRFMAFLMFTCLRPCEIYGLKWEDIDLDAGLISIERDVVFCCGKGFLGEPKTAESRRSIPIPESLRPYLTPKEGPGFILHMNEPEREGEHLSEQASRNMWWRIIKKIDVHGMTPYMGRHTYATNMNKAGVPLNTAMAIMGHKDERMLARTYVHVDKEDMLNASKAVDGYLRVSGKMEK